jgi:protease I
MIKRSSPIILLASMALSMTAAMGTAQTKDANSLAGKRVAIMTADGFQDAEVLVPLAYLTNRGAVATVIGIKPAVVKAYNNGMTVAVQKSIETVKVSDFDMLFIPGGHAPEVLRKHEPALTFARAFTQSGKPVAAICHGPQVLVSAGVIKGRKATSFSGVGKEITEAGGLYSDVPLMRDGNLITSRVPDDLPVFCEAIREALAK